MGYEIWDTRARALVADFDEKDEALDFLRDVVGPLNAEGITRRLEPLELVRISDDGQTTEVVGVGVDLLTLIFAPASIR